MKVRRREIVIGIAMSVLIAFSAIYLNTRSERNYSLQLTGVKSAADTGSLEAQWSLGQASQQRSQLISETIEGELNKGAFENVINQLEVLADEKYGYVKSLRMIYQDQAWSGWMLCKIPPTNVTSFTFGARALIEANGTVTYISISIEDVNSTELQENMYSAINLNLKEAKSQSIAGIGISLAPVLSLLSTSLFLIAQGLIVGLPLCFASLGVVLLIDRGIIPLWKNMLKKHKQIQQV